MKICTNCNEEKILSNFNNSCSTQDGKKNQCRACAIAYNTKWRLDNKEKHNTSNKLNYGKNKVKYLAKHKEWKQSNPSLVASYRARRRASKLNATPPWLTAEHHKQMEDVYWLSKDVTAISGEAYHVDHIVPLQGKTVCGLHVPWNLQVLPSDINLSKNNKHVA
jgi:hypothetical protein